MEHPGRDPLRGKFTRFLQESIKHCKIDYLRKSERRQVSLEALLQVQANHHRESTSAQDFNFHWEALGDAYRSLPRSYQEVPFLLLVKELRGIFHEKITSASPFAESLPAAYKHSMPT